MTDFTPAQIDERIKNDPEMQELAKNDETEFLARHEKIYNEFGYNPDGSPQSRALRGISKVARATGVDKDIMQGIANMPIPIATTIAGGIGGSVLGPGGTAAGAVAGSVAGEVINYKLGLRDEPGPVDLGVAALAPVVGPLASRSKSVLSNIGQALPGAGKHMHNIAAAKIAQQAQYMEVTDGMVQFMRQNFKNVPSFKADVPGVRAYLQQELDDVSRSLTVKYKNVKNGSSQVASDPYIAKLKITLDNMKDEKSFTFKQLMATERSFIELGADAPHAVWKKLSGVMIDDLEEQANNPKLTAATRDKILNGVEAFKNYVAVNQRKQGQDALNKFLHPGSTGSVVTLLDDGLVRFNKPAFLKALESDSMQVFEKTERDAMKKAISDLGYIAPSSVMSLKGATHTGSYGALGLGAYAIGGVSGVVTYAMILGALRLGISTQTGRNVIEYLAKKGHGRIDGAELHSTIGKVMAGMSAGSVAGVSGAGTAPSGIQPGSTVPTAPFKNQE